jgi:DNA polymerase epsilon subunit 1
MKRWEFPNRIGSYHKYVVPALEFSKFISVHIFGLEDAFHSEAHTLKMNLLRMIRCKEFSEEVQGGIEPSLILVVPDVICENC